MELDTIQQCNMHKFDDKSTLSDTDLIDEVNH